MKKQAHNLRKAAVLVASLDAERAAAVLGQMSPEQAQAVRAAVDTLGTPDPIEQQAVIEEFFRLGPLVPDREPHGIELNHPQCSELTVPRTKRDENAPAGAPGSAASREDSDEPGSRLKSASTESLAAFLSREQSQVVAVVLSRLPSQRAADVLAVLPAEVQIEAARRLSDLDQMAPEIVQEIEQSIESWLCEQDQTARRRAAGRTALAKMLEAANPQTREHVLSALSGPVAEPVTPQAEASEAPSASFADVTGLDSSSLSAVLRHANRDLLVLALAAAPREFVRRALETFPPLNARILEKAVCNLGPTRLSDIEQAQQELACVMQELESRGEINPGTPRHLSVAV